MTIKESDMVIASMRDIIIQTAKPSKIVLFGSYAKGTATVNSDADFLVVEDNLFGPSKSRRKEAARILKALLSFDIPKDILVYSIEEVNYFKNNILHVIGQAMQTGKVLYERPE